MTILITISINFYIKGANVPTSGLVRATRLKGQQEPGEEGVTDGEHQKQHLQDPLIMARKQTKKSKTRQNNNAN